jgi:hypothetical protein
MKTALQVVKPLPDQDIGQQAAALAVRLLATAETDSDLAHVIVAWPHLPDHIRSAILALIGTAR